MKNYPDLGGCYPASASVDNTLLDLHNSSYPTKAEFNNYRIFFGLLESFFLPDFGLKIRTSKKTTSELIC